MMMLAQATQPTTFPAIPVIPVDPHYPLWVNVALSIMGGMVAVLTALAIVLPMLGKTIKDVRDTLRAVQGHAVEAKTAAAEALGGIDAMQQGMTRMSTRQNEQARIVTGVALKVDPSVKPPPPKPADEGGGTGKQPWEPVFTANTLPTRPPPTQPSSDKPGGAA